MESLERKGNCRRAGSYSLAKQPSWAVSCAFSSQFPPDQRAVSTVCIIHEAEIANSMLWLRELASVQADFDVCMLWMALMAVLPLFATASHKLLLRSSTAELQNFLTLFTRKAFFSLKETIPTGAIWCLMKQVKDKNPINTVRVERRNKTCLGTPAEMGKYSAVSQSGAKPIPTSAQRKRISSQSWSHALWHASTLLWGTSLRNWKGNNP